LSRVATTEDILVILVLFGLSEYKNYKYMYDL